jgi:hypothetical protein
VGRWLVTLTVALCVAPAARAQQPFSTDDADVTAKGKFHLECFNEYDLLADSQRPHLQQNTFNIKANYGLGHGLELDLDAPLIAIGNDATLVPQWPFGMGDLDFGVKYNFHEEREGSSAPALAVALYTEMPTGEVSTGLGSGLVDIWTYAVVQKTLPRDFVMHVNGGYLFHGNTSTGVVGITTVRGHVATMGGSVLRRMSKALTLGVDVSAAVTGNAALERAQFQVMLGGEYELRGGYTLTLGVVAGHYTASPRIGVQVGFSWDQQ